MKSKISSHVLRESLTKIKLAEAKQRGVRLLISDFDGTLVAAKNPKYDVNRALKLVVQIAGKSIIPAIITARDASLKRIAFPEIQGIFKLKHLTVSVYLAFANGSNMWVLEKSKWHKIYNHGLTNEKIHTAIDCYQKLMKDLRLNRNDLRTLGLSTFTKFLLDLTIWKGYIPSSLLQLAKKFDGALFIEQSKISCVLPKEPKFQIIFTKLLQQKLGPRYHIKGDNNYIHISKRISDKGHFVDSKLYALNTILRLTKIAKQHVVAFGDAPDGNDKEFLAALPYGFTNDQSFVTLNTNIPPYILRGKASPVAAVYDAISFLIS